MNAAKFQSYQSKQINPDLKGVQTMKTKTLKFQSYQSKQINPDMDLRLRNLANLSLVSIVSIQTDQSRRAYWNHSSQYLDEFQSYQSKQINPDENIATLKEHADEEVSIVSIQTDQSRLVKESSAHGLVQGRFNRINPNRSIPTWGNLILHRWLLLLFQSYQSKQINPD